MPGGQAVFADFVLAEFRQEVDILWEGDDTLTEWFLCHFPELAEADFAGLEIRRTFSRLNGAILDLVGRAHSRDRAYEKMTKDAGDSSLLRYAFFACPTKTMAVRLRQVLRDSGRFDRVYFEIGSVFPDPGAGCANHPYDDRHLGEAPRGVGALYSHRFRGGDGLGLRLADIEGGWAPYHEDLSEVGITITGYVDDRYKSHGNGVLGVIAALADGRGITGVAPGVGSVRAFSVYRDAKFTSIRRTPDAIYAAIEELRFGDVLLLEVQGNDGNGENYPLEVDRAIFEVVRFATALGIVVVEPAGNGNADLDEPSSDENLKWWWEEDDLDSGAILVSASSSIDPYRPLFNSGSRIDCFAWGELVWTASAYLRRDLETRKRWLRCAFPEIDEKRCAEIVDSFDAVHEMLVSYYSHLIYGNDGYQCFGGTSAASAIIAGVALCVQGLSQANLGFRFSPWQLRLILRDPANGTSSSVPATDKIGTMPDLKVIIDEVLRLPADLYLRDRVGDVGDRPRTRTAESPDIIYFPKSFRDADRRLGEGSGKENYDSPYDRFVPGPGTYFYVRLRNRGGEACNASIRLYRAPVAPLPQPSSWELLGSDSLFVSSGDLLTVSNAIRWPKDVQSQSASIAPEQIERCAWIALAETESDPVPSLDELRVMSCESFLKFWRKCNNIACRNSHVVGYGEGETPDYPDYLRLKLQIHRLPNPEPPNPELKDRLEVLSCLPRGASAWLEMPADLADLQGISRMPHEIEKINPDGIFVPVNPNGRSYFRERIPAIAKGAVSHLQLVVQIPQGLRVKPHRIAVRQMIGQEEIGRVTWRIVPKEFGKSIVV